MPRTYREAADAYMKAWREAGQIGSSPPPDADAVLDALIDADSADCRRRGWDYPDRGVS